MGPSWIRAAGLALALAMGLGGSGAPAGAASGTPARISGVLRDCATGAVLPGVTVRLGPGHRAVTDRAGRFCFAKVETGVYRVLVTGSCDEVPVRVDVRPGEDQEIAVTVERGCEEAARLGEPPILGPRIERRPWRALVVARDRVGSPNQCEVDGDVAWDLSGPGPTGTAVVASQELSARDRETLAPGAGPVPPGADWIALQQEDCFTPWSGRWTISASGELRVHLIPEWGLPEGTPILRRTLCAGCVESFFRDLRALDLPALTGAFESKALSASYCTMGGVIGGEPFLVRTSRVRLAPIEAARTRFLDLCAYRGCVDPGDRVVIPASVTIEAPAEVRAGERFTVRARATVGPGVDVSGAVLQLDARAPHVSGQRAASGPLGDGRPLVVAALCEGRSFNPDSTIKIYAYFAAENAWLADPAVHFVTRTVRVTPR